MCTRNSEPLTQEKELELEFKEKAGQNMLFRCQVWPDKGTDLFTCKQPHLSPYPPISTTLFPPQIPLLSPSGSSREHPMTSLAQVTRSSSPHTPIPPGSSSPLQPNQPGELELLPLTLCGCHPRPTGLVAFPGQPWEQPGTGMIGDPPTCVG